MSVTETIRKTISELRSEYRPELEKESDADLREIFSNRAYHEWYRNLASEILAEREAR